MGKNRKNKSRKRKVIIWSLIICLILIVSTYGIGYLYIDNILKKVETIEVNTEPNNIGINPEIEEEFKEIRNIALLGIDSSEDDLVGRSDSIMILTLDSIHNKIKLTSIMRDSYVNIDGYGMDKINHAYAYGGAELALKTLNGNFDLNIKEVIAINFSSLINIINKIGGVNIDITDEEVSHISGISSSGNHLLNGKQALAYSRIRYATGGDYKRTERQRTVIKAIFNKLKNTELTKYPELVNEFLPYVKTNISSTDLLKLGTEFSRLASKELEQDRFPRDEQGKGKTIDGIYYLTFDLETVKNSIKDYIFNDK
ncbi:LCP family protein [Clostridium sp. DSM 100503]|uniref:LCP family protein n=1 Tax=Clostridium sp. DSM 100503 TaxID=2963282 RepID=UPI00214A8363|nr:LCP family protein [Clostridium sp. DSM 100503]MCR1951286.1 LCP family protein [Clostridium sp. DSM 100503]